MLKDGCAYRFGEKADIHHATYENRAGVLMHTNAASGVVYPALRVDGDRLLHYFTGRHVLDTADLALLG